MLPKDKSALADRCAFRCLWDLDKFMIIRRFQQWARTAPPSQRAAGVGALARAYLYAGLDEAARDDAELILTQFLDDPSPLVRRTLAESFASAANAPHHIVLALADDQSDVSSIVLGRSPVLSESELIDCAAIGDPIAQSAIALRPNLPVAVAAAIAEIGAREALISLAVNLSVELPIFSMRRMIERFGADGEVREALLTHRPLPAALRAALVAATATALGAFVTDCDWLSPQRAERVMREARDHAHIIIAATSPAVESGPMQLVAHLRASGQLTASLLLRALLSGSTNLFEAALAHLADVALPRVKGLISDWPSAGFAALYRRAGLAEPLLPAFRAALEALATLDPAEPGDARLSRQRVERVLTACKAMNNLALDRLLAVLRRFEAEAARDEARSYAAALPGTPVREVGVPEAPLLILTDPDAAPTPPHGCEGGASYTIDMDALAAALAA
ncbi:hypothetical protein MHY1_00835 [Methylovirgula sp. HY1]|nr:hypothetical protein MHY1_00835 [Methylovirgula sp. HY1]